MADKTQRDAPASIAAVGFALAVYPVGVERGWMTRAEAILRTLAVLWAREHQRVAAPLRIDAVGIVMGRTAAPCIDHLRGVA